ncbi:MAG: TonB-dependent receptor [Myxococcota bacterium]
MPFVAPVTSRRLVVRSFLMIAMSTLLGLELPAAAQSSADDPFAGIEEMVVVGTGAGALLQSQEVSAINFDAEYLEALGASDLSDISQFTPNLEIRTPFAASNPTLFIRGVGLRDFNANSSSSVAVYNDEIYMNSPAGQLAQLFDVENIDVLRGPQGTIYGRNASAGTIRVVARKPTGTPGASFKATYGRFNQVEIDGAVENVIVPDMISMRTSFRYNLRDGFVRNRCGDSKFNTNPNEPFLTSRRQRVFNQCFALENTFDALAVLGGNAWNEGETPPVVQWVNDTNNWGARSLIRFQGDAGPLELDFTLNVHGGQNRGDARQFQTVGATQGSNDLVPDANLPEDFEGYTDPDNQFLRPGPPNSFESITSPFDGDPYEGDYNNVEKEKLDLFGASITGDITFGDYSLTTVTGYEWNERRTQLNLDGNPFVGLEPLLTNEAYQLTQELRLDYDPGDTIKWQLGGMYLYEGLQVDNTFLVNLNQPGTKQGYSFFTRYAAFWGNGSWEPMETFKVEGGLRFNYEDKELNLVSQQFERSGGVPPVPFPRFAAAATKDIGLAGDLKATYSPIEDWNFYIRYARGWKGPHINGGVINPTQSASDGSSLTTPVEPEKIDAVEMGMKATFWEARIKANWALFYYDYQDIQVFRLQNTSGGVPVQQLINADDADILGFEAEFDIKPFEGWGPMLLDQFWLHATFAWLDSKYTDFVNTETVVSTSGQLLTRTEDFSGNRLINSPEYSFIGFVAWPLGGDWGTVIPRLDWTFKDEVFFNPNNSSLLKQDPLWLLNFRTTYKSPSDNFEVSAWVQNLTDQAYTVDVFNLARLRRSILHAVGDPRTYGVTATVKF